MVTNHDDAVFDHHPTTTRGFTETVNWALKHAKITLCSNWLRVLDPAERSQVDQRIRQQLHPIVPPLDTFKSE